LLYKVLGIGRHTKRGDTLPQGLGELEQMAVPAVLRAQGEVCGAPILEEIERPTGRMVSGRAVYLGRPLMDGAR
jgi:hypothetical protein